MRGAEFGRLEDSEDEIFQAWLQRLRRVGRLKHVCASREDCRGTLRALIAALQLAGEDGDTSLFAFSAKEADFPGMSVIEQARNWRNNGIALDVFMYFFKLLVRTVESHLLAGSAAGGHVSPSLLALRRTVDVVEAAVIDDWEKTDRNESTRELEKLHRRLIMDKNRYECFFRTTTNLAMVTNSEGIVIEANPEANSFFGGRKVLGRYCWELLQLGVRTLPQVFQKYHAERSHEVTLHVDADRFVLEMRCLRLDADSESQQALFLLNDITRVVDERLALQRRARERASSEVRSEKMLGSIFMSVGEGILLVDEDREIVKANQRAGEIFGVLEQNLIGARIDSMVDDAGAALIEGFLSQMIEGQRLSGEVTGAYVDGSPVPLTVTVTRFDLEGRRYWSMIVRDNTARETMASTLRHEMKQAEDVNTALRTIMKRAADDRREFENRIAVRIRHSLLPGLEKIGKEENGAMRRRYVTLLEDQLVSLTSGSEAELDAGLLRLSRTELEVCRLIRSGASCKEISEGLNISVETVQTHRKNIRKKLDLAGKRVNLHTYLHNRSF